MHEKVSNERERALAVSNPLLDVVCARGVMFFSSRAVVPCGSLSIEKEICGFTRHTASSTGSSASGVRPTKGPLGRPDGRSLPFPLRQQWLAPLPSAYPSQSRRQRMVRVPPLEIPRLPRQTPPRCCANSLTRLRYLPLGRRYLPLGRHCLLLLLRLPALASSWGSAAFHPQLRAQKLTRTLQEISTDQRHHRCGRNGVENRGAEGHAASTLCDIRAMQH